MKKNTITIDLQVVSSNKEIPEMSWFEQWVSYSLQNQYPQLEQTIRIVDEKESQSLNKCYRSKDKPTNVLSFPAESSEYLDYDTLGDLVICAPVIEKEAQQQNKTINQHWAHMVIHGMLHLQGFDHINEQDAVQMEALEIEILAALGHTNPYL